MKKLAVLALALFFVLFTGCKSAPVGDDGNKWYDKVEEALAVAKKENKTVLVNFTGSDWCIWCKRLNAEVFSQKEFRDYAEKNLVLVKIDFPKSIKQTEETQIYNQMLQSKYAIEGFPTIILLNADGKHINTTGYQQGGAASYVEHLKSLIK